MALDLRCMAGEGVIDDACCAFVVDVRHAGTRKFAYKSILNIPQSAEIVFRESPIILLQPSAYSVIQFPSAPF